jgi:hypothetical protein
MAYRFQSLDPNPSEIVFLAVAGGDALGMTGAIGVDGAGESISSDIKSICC